jgi:hypothetical protein
MAIKIQKATKARVVKHGPVRTFGDYDERQRMDESELETVFDQVWATGLEQAVAGSHPCTIEVARPKLKEAFRSFLDARQEQRQFRYQDLDFIVQLKESPDGERELTQLWKTEDPKTLSLTFDTAKERKQFAVLARDLGWDDEKLGLELVRDFMRKFRRQQDNSGLS